MRTHLEIIVQYRIIKRFLTRQTINIDGWPQFGWFDVIVEYHLNPSDNAKPLPNLQIKSMDDQRSHNTHLDLALKSLERRQQY